MKNRFPALLLVLAAICAGLICQAPLRAQNPEAASAWPYYYTGSYASWTVPQSGSYTITAFGASGGDAYVNADYHDYGGLAACRS